MRERTFVFRTLEDPTVEARPQGCPFEDANVFLGGRMYSLEMRDSDGEVVDERAHAIGTAAACAAIRGPLEPGALAPFYAEFTFEDGAAYAAEGVARVTSNDVPVQGVVLAGCSLRLVGGPPGLVGGAATSASVFDPSAQLGGGTGSLWTLRAYFA